jgi:hypothetical protein
MRARPRALLLGRGDSSVRAFRRKRQIMLKRIIVASVLDADALFVIAAALFVCGCVVLGSR